MHPRGAGYPYPPATVGLFSATHLEQRDSRYAYHSRIAAKASSFSGTRLAFLFFV